MPESAVESHLFVILGGTGDLAARKLLPALRRLKEQDLLDADFRVLGVSRRTDLDDEGYRAWARDALPTDAGGADGLDSWCRGCLHYASLGSGTEEDFRSLARQISEIETEGGLSGNRTFYLSLPAEAFGPTIEGLGAAGLAGGPGWTRLVIEKPFGHDLTSARDLNKLLHRYFTEQQIYRIDHYLGKETVQNLMVFRFGNAIFEDLWNRDRIECVQITVAETLGVEERGAFYEQTGALRDIVQNHLIQVLALVAMEVPMAFAAGDIRHEKLKVLRSIRAPEPGDVVWGQYARGAGAAGEMTGYREEERVAPDSRVETYLAMRLYLDSWRWQGVPFYIRSGKRLDQKLTQIAVSFRRPPVCLFESMGSCLLHRNDLFITLQPDEGFTLQIDVKAPGTPLALQRVPLDFRYAEAFGSLPDAYETLLLDVFEGDQTLFVSADETEASWQLFDGVAKGQRTLHFYPAGSSGPQEADELLAVDGQSWLRQ